MRLVSLNLCGCFILRRLPDNICSLRALEVLNIYGCSSLQALPKDLGNIESLKVLNASVLRVSKIPDSIGRLSNLAELKLLCSKNLVTLPNSICNLRSLELLYISECEKLEEFPDQLGIITSLRKLDTRGATMLKTIPDISRLLNIVHLELTDCHQLWSIAELPHNLKRIKAAKCWSLKRLPDLSNLKQLEELDLKFCRSMERLPDLSNLKQLRKLELRDCSSIEILQNISNLKQLTRLDLANCTALTEIQGPEELTLDSLNLWNCVSLLSIPELATNVKCIDAFGCRSMQRLRNLSNLNLKNYRGLTEIIGLEELTSLRELYLTGCNSSLLAYTLTNRFFQVILISNSLKFCFVYFKISRFRYLKLPPILFLINNLNKFNYTLLDNNYQYAALIKLE